MTSHAAVVARGMGKPAVAGCSEIVPGEYAKDTVHRRRQDRGQGRATWMTMDGTKGEVIDLGEIPSWCEPQLDDRRPSALTRFMGWTDEIRTLKVRTNADTPHDSRRGP